MMQSGRTAFARSGRILGSGLANARMIGVVPIEVALRLAQEADLDLVEVAPNSKPPVVKIMDYGKFKYEEAQKAKEARRNQANTILKEVRFRLKIDKHDYETKRKRAEESEGAKRCDDDRDG